MNSMTNKCFHKVTHIIFDLDGTLLNTEPIYEQLYCDLIANYGKSIPASLSLKYRGSPAKFAIETLIDELELSVPFDVLFEEYKLLQLQRLGVSTTLMKGAERIIKHFHRNHIPMAIATSSEPESAKLKMASFPELFKLMHHIVTTGDVINGKPSPDIYILAAKRFPDQPRPELCLAFEDAPNGVVAARAAKMQCVMTPNERDSVEDRQSATIVLESLDDFEPELFGLPKFDT